MISVRILPEAAMTRTEFGDVQDFKDTFVISIVSPGREHPNITGTNVHKFHFHDVQEVYELSNGRLIMPMSESVAEAIVDVAIKNLGSDSWIIHCEAGISRSPAVAIGLAQYVICNPTKEKLKEMFPLYNKYVAMLIENALHKRMGELVSAKIEELKEK